MVRLRRRLEDNMRRIGGAPSILWLARAKDLAPRHDVDATDLLSRRCVESRDRRTRLPDAGAADLDSIFLLFAR